MNANELLCIAFVAALLSSLVGWLLWAKERRAKVAWRSCAYAIRAEAAILARELSKPNPEQPNN